MRHWILILLLGLAQGVAAQTLVITIPGKPAQTLDRAALQALNVVDVGFTNKREADGRSDEQTVRYKAVRLTDVLARAGVNELERRAIRAAAVIASATDGYAVAFSWGELFNHASGNNIFVLLSLANGAALPTSEGPYALRALDDVRPGPRHVRMLSELRILVPQSP